MLLLLLLLPLSLVATTAAVAPPPALVGAHYFGGWCVARHVFGSQLRIDARNSRSQSDHLFQPVLRYSCATLNQSQSKCCDHFSGFSPRGAPVTDWFTLYPERIPILGNLSTDPETIANEVAVADKNIVSVILRHSAPRPSHPFAGFLLDAIL
jgi:hypothetical protein